MIRVQPGPTRTPAVTVVVPCYNYGRYLPDCVDAILNQPGVTVEVIIVDDASTDGSGDVAADLAASNDSVRLIRHAHNTGHIQTYNDGLAAATGDYVALVSADDLLTPGSLHRATALMEAYPSVGFVYGHVVLFADNVPLSARTQPTNWILWSGYDWLTRRFRLGANCIWSPEVVLRASIQRSIGPYKPALPHTGDMEMWMRAAAISDVGYVAGVDQAWYRDHGTNMHSIIFQTDQPDGIVVDLRERMRTFELMGTELLGRVPTASRLINSAQRAIAVLALTSCIRSFYWGIPDRWPVQALAELALEVYPEAERLLLWKLLSLHQKIGSGRARRDPLSLAHELMLRAQLATVDWRLAQVGI